jgi:hypothetical protein
MKEILRLPRPTHFASVSIQSSEDPVAGAQKDDVACDRRRVRNSAAGRVAPERTRLRAIRLREEVRAQHEITDRKQQRTDRPASNVCLPSSASSAFLPSVHFYNP